MSGTVNILTPNGRRQNLKYSANMTILQIIEKVCEKQGFVSAEYDLRHQRKILDPKLSMRFCNIPNNAKLELVKAEKARTESATQIALQLPDGQRLQHTFLPSSSLWDIIVHWQQKLDRNLLADEDGKQIEPSLVYMTHNVTGESMLKETKLRSIGLTGGKAVIRLSGRVVDLPHVADHQSSTEKSMKNEPKKAELETSESEHCMDTGEEVEKPTHSTAFHQNPEERVGIQSEEANADTVAQFNVEQNPIRPEERKDIDVKSDIEISESVEANTCLGVDVRRKETRNPPVKQPLQNPGLHTNPFADFKFPESVTDVDSSSQMNTDECIEVLSQPCDREAVVFDLSSNDNVPGINRATPDEFFEVTVDDVRKMLADLQHKSTKNAPLETNQMRENKEKMKMCHYKKIVIRIVFPDKTVLQGFFRPQETVQVLFEFVQTSLEEKSLEFYLYTSPPKKNFKNMKETLFEAGLFPAAKVYFGCKYTKSTWLSPSLLSSLTPVAVANESLTSVTGIVETGNKPSTSKGQTLEASTVGASKRPSSSTTLDSTTNTQKIPKWFKLGKQ